MPQTRAVIFDFGGTLFTYEGMMNARGGRARLFAEWLELPGDDLGPVVAAIRKGSARSAEKHFARPFYMHREMFEDGGRYAAEELGRAMTPEIAGRWGTLFLQGFGNITPRPGMEEMLRELRRRDIHVGSASNADIAQFDAMVESLGVRELFDSLLCSEEARSCKPDTAIYNEALRRAGCSPQEAIFVGDTPDHDIVGADSVGMRSLLIEETTTLSFNRGQPRKGQVVIKELMEILDHL